MRVLLVEDEALARQRAGRLLERLGHEVSTCEDGASAFRAWEAGGFAVVLTDWQLPGMDGLQLCRSIRAERRPAYTSVIVQTVRGGKENFLAAMEAGADDFLEKPLEADTLAARLGVAARVRDLYEELDRLRGLVPICSYCKKVRSDSHYWQQVEAYISARSHARFSHTICPDCLEAHVKPEMEHLRRKGARE
ncbi:MAG: response regulator [Acidobacteria bacterium]|nr:response regulator [Acidobacteriota bacterium]